MKKLIVIALSAILVLGMVSCNNSNPLTDPTNPLNPSNPNSPLNPSNPNNPNNQDKIFPVSEAEEVSAAFINGLDKKALAGMLGKNQGYQLGDELTVYVADEEFPRTYPTDGNGLAGLMGDIRGNTDNALDVRQIESMVLPVTFTNCKNGFHADSDLESIDGIITVTIVPTVMKEESGNMSVTAGVYLSSNALTVKFKNNEDTYKFVLNNFATLVDAENIDMSNPGELLGYFYLPEKHNEQSVKVTKDNVTRTVKWCDISENLPGTNFYENGTIEGRLKETFYNHFATLGFLHDLHNVIESTDKAIDTMKITNSSLALTDINTKLSITFELNGYGYYVDETNQKATGTVTVEFTGTLSDTDDTEFTATEFTISSEGDITLSDDGNRFANKVFTITDVEGTIGTASGSGIVFNVTGDDTKTVNSLTYYYNVGDKNANPDEDTVYDNEKHSFNADLF